MTTARAEQRRHRRWPAAALVAVLGVAAAGCSERGGALGEGDDVNLCVAMALVDSLPEPSPEDPADLLRYAQALVRVLERVEPEDEIEQRDSEPILAPEAVLNDVQTAQARAASFRDRLEAAGTDERAVRDAANEFAADEQYTAADARVVTWTYENCEG